jgi:hypothetical protein
LTAFDYSGLRATAERLIIRFGRAATLVKLTPGSGYDPGEPSEASTSVMVVADNYSQRERDGTLVEQNDRRYYMVSTTVPESQDVILDGAERLTIINVEVIRPGATAVLYVLQVRA